MFQQIPAAGPVIAVAFSNRVSKEDIRNYESILEEKLSKHDKVALCVDLNGTSDFTADALVEGAKADLELLSHLRQVRRMAMISDKEWPRAVMAAVAPLLGGTEVRHFAAGEREKALTWAAELA